LKPAWILGVFLRFLATCPKNRFPPAGINRRKHNGKGNKKPPVPAQQVVLAENSSDYFANCA
jgi:hypothetical protein